VFNLLAFQRASSLRDQKKQAPKHQQRRRKGLGQASWKIETAAMARLPCTWGLLQRCSDLTERCAMQLHACPQASRAARIRLYLGLHPCARLASMHALWFEVLPLSSKLTQHEARLHCWRRGGGNPHVPLSGVRVRTFADFVRGRRVIQGKIQGKGGQQPNVHWCMLERPQPALPSPPALWQISGTPAPA